MDTKYCCIVLLQFSPQMLMRKSDSKWSTLLRLCLHWLRFNLVFSQSFNTLHENTTVAILCSWTETSVTYTVGWEDKWMSRGADQKCGKDRLVWGLSSRGENSNLNAFTFSTAHSAAWARLPSHSPLYQHTVRLYTQGSGGHEMIKMSINYWILYQEHSPQPLSK